VISILQKRIEINDNIAVVFSAFQSVTDSLIEIGNLALKRNAAYKSKLKTLTQLHFKAINELNQGYDISILQYKAESLFEELSEILHGVFLVKELTAKSLDYIVSFGERLSCTIISESMINRGIDCEYLNASQIIKTDNDFGKARVNFKLTNRNIKAYFKKHKKIQIVTGFISSTEENEITTLGRGGSDYTAAIIGAAIDADAIEIWTDVDGILTADPRKVADAFSLKSVTYEEAMELSHFGAKVIYPPTMLPALDKKIKIIIKNTFNPEAAGTMIIEKSREHEVPMNKSATGSRSGKSIGTNIGSGAGLGSGISIGADSSSNTEMGSRKDRIFNAASGEKIKPDSTSEMNTKKSSKNELGDDQASDSETTQEEFFIKGISSIDNVSLIRVQGSGMIGVSGIASRLFTALALHKINIILITQASSEHSICLAVLPEHGEKSKAILKNEFRLELLDKIIGEIKVEDNLSIIAVVGEKMRHSPGIAGKIFMALGDNAININAIAQGSSELNISLVINKDDLSKALNAIHSKIIKRN
jgi:aspartokinase/homoserine dehydrogenase 1